MTNYLIIGVGMTISLNNYLFIVIHNCKINLKIIKHNLYYAHIKNLQKSCPSVTTKISAEFFSSVLQEQFV
jgi:hypothetical protein